MGVWRDLTIQWRLHLIQQKKTPIVFKMEDSEESKLWFFFMVGLVFDLGGIRVTSKLAGKLFRQAGQNDAGLKDPCLMQPCSWPEYLPKEVNAIERPQGGGFHFHPNALSNSG